MKGPQNVSYSLALWCGLHLENTSIEIGAQGSVSFCTFGQRPLSYHYKSQLVLSSKEFNFEFSQIYHICLSLKLEDHLDLLQQLFKFFYPFW